LSFEYPKYVRFKCKRCASCCGDTQNRTRSILLSKPEADYISKKTFMDINIIAEETGGFEPYVYAMKKTKDGKCIFLKSKSCTIYPMRPLVCRFYPFPLRSLGNDRYVFDYAEECLGIGKGSKLKKSFFKNLFQEACIEHDKTRK